MQKLDSRGTCGCVYVAFALESAHSQWLFYHLFLSKDRYQYPAPNTSSVTCVRNLLGNQYAERVAYSVAVIAEPAHLLLALTAGLLLETDHAAAATAPAVPGALLKELPAFIKCTEQLYDSPWGLSVIHSDVCTCHTVVSAYTSARCFVSCQSCFALVTWT